MWHFSLHIFGRIGNCCSSDSGPFARVKVPVWASQRNRICSKDGIHIGPSLLLTSDIFLLRYTGRFNECSQSSKLNVHYQVLEEGTIPEWGYIYSIISRITTYFFVTGLGRHIWAYHCSSVFQEWVEGDRFNLACCVTQDRELWSLQAWGWCSRLWCFVDIYLDWNSQSCCMWIFLCLEVLVTLIVNRPFEVIVYGGYLFRAGLERLSNRACDALISGRHPSD
jgi:hypothetical protein